MKQLIHTQLDPSVKCMMNHNMMQTVQRKLEKNKYENINQVFSRASVFRILISDSFCHEVAKVDGVLC